MVRSTLPHFIAARLQELPERERNRLLEDVHTARHNPPWARDFIEVMCLDDKGAWM